MQYVRPKPAFKLSKQERADLLKRYYEFCAQQAGVDVSTLNIKVPRAAFIDLHNRVGELLLETSKRLATQPGPLRDFLGAHPVPECMKPYLPDEYRAFCLALNSLKQWSVSTLMDFDIAPATGVANKVFSFPPEIGVLAVFGHNGNYSPFAFPSPFQLTVVDRDSRTIHASLSHHTRVRKHVR